MAASSPRYFRSNDTCWRSVSASGSEKFPRRIRQSSPEIGLDYIKYD